jgi:hypothetical protein
LAITSNYFANKNSLSKGLKSSSDQSRLLNMLNLQTKATFTCLLAFLLAIPAVTAALVELDEVSAALNHFVWSSRWQIEDNQVSDQDMRWLADTAFLEMRDMAKEYQTERRKEPGKKKTTLIPATLTVLQVGGEIYMSSSIRGVATRPWIIKVVENSGGNQALLSISRQLSVCLASPPVNDNEVPAQASDIKEAHQNNGSCGEIVTALQFATANSHLTADQILEKLKGARVITVGFVLRSTDTVEVKPPCVADNPGDATAERKPFGCQNFTGQMGWTVIPPEVQIGTRPLNLQRLSLVSACSLIPSPSPKLARL